MLLSLHLLVLGWLALRPVTAPWTGPPNLTPFASVHEAMAAGGFAAVRRVVSGLLPLAPVGVLLPLAVGTPHRAWVLSFLRTTGAVALLGTGLEIVEGWAPGHVLNVDDILLGTLGAALAHLLLMPVLRAFAVRRPAASRPQPGPRPGAAEGREEARPRPVPARALSGRQVQPFR
ncbi:VanZ family protein [Kitasatospora cheerisanensis]|uniref:VanZ family protein n=1 Tax=Kitasatospora cheerisanensis TaxID=81942 RepID=UPI00143158A0|nr:VanZ family protein [Kitasatospora cheerisanensis]